jgi:hypothetical protein
MHMTDDGVQRWVVAHRDPGVPNWIDTTGLPRGYLSNRWAYSTIPPKSEWPKIAAHKVPFDEVRCCFPTNTPTVDANARRHAIAVRQQHVQRRYRAF